VIINDKYEIVYRIWKFLQLCSPADILSLPKLKPGDKIDRSSFDCIEMAWLMGFMINSGCATPMLTMSRWGYVNFPRSVKIILENLHKIKHWTILNLDYLELESYVGTHFIDPPYIAAGYKYRFGSDKIDFNCLSEWCKNRQGQIIVCEDSKANWLPFNPMKRMNGIVKTQTEGIYTNEFTQYNNIQQLLKL